MKKRKLLFISYHFPPTGGSAVQRPLKFVKYLPYFGWEPVVLTVLNSSFECSDRTLLQDFPRGICVSRIRRLPILPFAETYRTRTKHNYDSNGKLVFLQNNSQFFKPFSFIINRLFDAIKYMANNFVYIPDRHVGWLPGAVIKGVFLVKKNNMKIIYATGEPWTSFLAAFLIAKLTKTPYILDFRDPWTLEPNMMSPGAVHKWFCNRLEKLCIRHAHKVIFAWNIIMKEYQAKYKSEQVGKFITITHGYEPEDFERVSRTNSDIFTISHIGTLYFHYRKAIDTFFRAISSIFKKNPQIRKNLQINFGGITRGLIDQYLQKYEFREIVKITGYVGFRDSIQYMVDSTVLLLFDDSGKAYEYLAAKRPILTLTSIETDVALLVRDNKAGIVLDPSDLGGIEKAILSFYNKSWKESHSSNIKKYTRKELAGKLAAEFDAVTMENNQILAAK